MDERPWMLNWSVWLGLLFVGFLLAEGIWPLKRERHWRRMRVLSDVGNWLAYYVGFQVVLYLTARHLEPATWKLLGELGVADEVVTLQLLRSAPLAVQAAVYVLVVDFIKYWVHRALHVVPFLWTFHKTHHSVRSDEMYFFVGARIHVVETALFALALHLPLLVLVVRPEVVFVNGVLAIWASYFTHANLNAGRRRWNRLLNAPHMHRWHHAYALIDGRSWNYATLFSLWDWLFGTAYLPDATAETLGYEGQEEMPNNVFGHQLYPLSGWLRAPLAALTAHSESSSAEPGQERL